jgi:hypothetical protein
MKRIPNIKTIGALATIVIVTVSILPLRLLAQQAAQNSGFTIRQVSFDISMGDAKPVPQIPKEWRFVGVCNGEKVNSNNLWFQDADGNIYIVQGFMSYRKFTLQEGIEKIEAAK